jgi:hypothetical protein
MEIMTHQTDANEKDKISNIIDRVLTQIFGEEATHMIYRYLERNYSLKRNEVSEKIDVFAEGLEKFLRSGAYAIERKILDDIYSSYGSLRRLELDRTQEENDFVGQMRLLYQKT